MKPKVFVTRALPGPALAGLAPHTELRVWPGPEPITAAQLRAEVADAEGLLCLLTDRIDGALLEAAPKLRVVSSCSVGVDHIDLAALARRGIPLGQGRITNLQVARVDTNEIKMEGEFGLQIR